MRGSAWRSKWEAMAALHPGFMRVARTMDEARGGPGHPSKRRGMGRYGSSKIEANEALFSPESLSFDS